MCNTSLVGKWSPLCQALRFASPFSDHTDAERRLVAAAMVPGLGWICGRGFPVNVCHVSDFFFCTQRTLPKLLLWFILINLSQAHFFFCFNSFVFYIFPFIFIIYLFLYLFIYLSIYFCIQFTLFIYLFIYFFIDSFIHLFIYGCIYLFICQFVYLFLISYSLLFFTCPPFTGARLRRSLSPRERTSGALVRSMLLCCMLHGEGASSKPKQLRTMFSVIRLLGNHGKWDVCTFRAFVIYGRKFWAFGGGSKSWFVWSTLSDSCCFRLFLYPLFYFNCN